MSHIILFGGSFNPIHYGHLEMAKNALKQRNADQVWFVLNKRSPFKEKSVSFDHRSEMIKIMIACYSKMKLCVVEDDLPDPSYTIDTMRLLNMRYPEHHFEWLLGSDQLASLEKWKDIAELKEIVEFVVYRRPSYNVKGEYIYIDGKEFSTSSTQIRIGESFDTHPLVLNYAMRTGIYHHELLAHKLSDSRYQHVLRVCTLALEIASCHKLDQEQVLVAAMMHDYCKEENKVDQKKRIDAVYSCHSNEPPALFHGYLASDFLAKKMYYTNKNVLRAISGHVVGSSNNDIGKVLFIADKCERGRGYDSETLICLSKKDLNVGFKSVKKEQLRYLRRNHE